MSTYSLARAQSEVDSLVAVLQSDAPYMSKLQACKRLAQLGAAESVPALAQLLRAEEKLSHAARIALEAIPDPAAGLALREAVAELDGLRRIGVIQSLGVRRDPEAVPVLASLLVQADPATAVAILEALGRIGSPEAVDLLRKYLHHGPEGLPVAAARALLLSCEQRIEKGQKPEALEILEDLGRAELPEGVRAAALRMAVLADSTGWKERLTKLLGGNSSEFAMALELARMLPRSEVAPLVAAELPSQSADRQVLLLAVLEDLAEPAVAGQVKALAESGESSVRAAAIRALGRVGDGTVFPLLLRAAEEADPAISAAARQALQGLTDPAVNGEIVKLLASAGEANKRSQLLILVELAGKRRIPEAKAALVPLSESPEPAVRRAAITSLGQILAPEDLPILTAKLVQPLSPEDIPVLQEAIRLASIRAADREKAAEALVALLPRVGPELKTYLYELLGSVGGKKALEALASAALDPAYQDTVTRVLGQWMGPAAAPVLLKVARESTDPRFRIRAWRGYLRIARQFDMPPTERLAMVEQALRAAERTEERVLALEVLERIGSVEALEVASRCLDQQQLAPAATRTVLNLAGRLQKTHPHAVRQALDRVLERIQDGEIRRRAEELRKGLAAESSPKKGE
jgi:HEAT repeat protein